MKRHSLRNIIVVCAAEEMCWGKEYEEELPEREFILLGQKAQSILKSLL